MDYRPTIESKYNRQNWQTLLYDIFRNKVQFWQQPQPVIVDRNMAKNALYTGKITLPDGHIIAIYEVELSDSIVIERNRVGIRNLLVSNWRGMGCAGAFMFCFRQNEAALRFSYVSESLAFAEDGSLTKESTDTKRFTYLLGEGHRSRTAIMQFEELKKSALDLKAITKAFSVEALSDMFFDEYKKQYEDIIEFITGKRFVKVGNKWEEKVTCKPCKQIMDEFSRFPDAEKAVRDYVKKLMGRLVFIQFLQKKGWMGCLAGEAWTGGDKEFVQTLFANTNLKDTFVDDVLEPLFNDINTRREGDLAGSPNVGVNIKIPYLNGGLFEEDDYDKTAFPLPAKYMKNMLDFFASYNFTIDENDPNDAEIGVDPEMLGRIFENLLEDNKDKGAFYTPKEIVRYMCQESLIAYLQTDIQEQNTKNAIRLFVTTYDASILSSNLKQTIDQKLRDVKICDPAIGSGAFPMGLLRELYACRKAIEGIDDETAVNIKSHIIQNNIYGVDIEKGAVDIARLRFWLALIVDEKNPHALPNMDFKIMPGNSLLEQYEGIDLSGVSVNELARRKAKKEQAWEQTLEFEELKALENVQNAIRKYYNTDDFNSKVYLRKIINNNVKEYIVNLKGCTPDIQKKIEELPIPNGQFFLWHIYFKEVFDKGGFDIVIGNPPYISAPTQFKSKVLREQRMTLARCRDYETLYQKWDLYIPFMEKGLKLLSKCGSFAMIVPFPLSNQPYAQKFRQWVLLHYDVTEIADLNGVKVFENANVYNLILFASNCQSKGETVISHVEGEDKIRPTFVQPHSRLVQDSKNSVWNFTQQERHTDRHEEMNVLGDFCFISYGLRPNSDERTARGEFRKADLISETMDDVHCRKYIEAKDISRYSINRVRYLEYGTERSPDKLVRPTFKEWFCVPKLFFNRLGELVGTLNYGDDFIHNDSIIGAGLWHDLHGVVNKSITSSIKKFSRLSRQGMEDLSRTVSLEYLLGVMNSRYATFLLSTLRGDDYHIYPEHIRNIRIPHATTEQQQPIVDLVRRVFAAKAAGEDTTALEQEIDCLVYKLYGLTCDEVRIVDPETNITEEEYGR